MREYPSEVKKSLMLVRTSIVCCPSSSSLVTDEYGGVEAVAVSLNSCNILFKALPHVATVTTAPPPVRAETVPAPAME